MASTIILSDNGTSSGSAGLKETAGNDGTLLLQTTTSGGTATTAVTIDNNQNVTLVGNITLNNGAADGAQLTLSSSGFSDWNIDNYSGNFRWYYNATEYMRLTNSGNLGLGVTPSTWQSTRRAMQIGYSGSLWANTGSESVAMGSNGYLNSGGSWTYLTTGYATLYSQGSGSHQWFNAASGSAAGALTFTQAMTLDVSGNLLVNTTTAREKITVNGSVAASGQLIPYSGSTSLGYIGNDSSISGGSGSNIGLRSEAAMLFATGGSTERARIDSSGNLLVGISTYATTPASGVTVQTGNNASVNVGHTNSSSGFLFVNFGYNGGQIGSITQNGTTGVLYNLTSDYRLKNNPTPVTGAKEFVMALQPKTWDWWDGSGKGVGFIAHEFMEVAKHSGNGTKDAVDEEGNPVYQSIQPSSSEVMANLVAHIQELETRLAALENK